MTLNEIKTIVDQLLVDYPDKDIAAMHIADFIMGIKRVEREYEEDKLNIKDLHPAHSDNK